MWAVATCTRGCRTYEPAKRDIIEEHKILGESLQALDLCSKQSSLDYKRVVMGRYK